MEICFAKTVDAEKVARAMKILADNGVDADECGTVIQAIGYALCDIELQPLIDEALALGA